MHISVITVSFNSGSTIADCCHSISRQDATEIEHCIVDGNSSDDTVAVCKDHIRTGGRIVSEPDAGIYDAMNKGLRLARGDIVGFLNADDVFHDDHALAAIASAFADPDVDAVFGNLVYVAQDDVQRVVRYWDSSRFNPAAFAYGVMPPHPTLYIRRRVIERLGGFRLDLPMANDFEFCVRYLARHRIRCRHIPRVLVRMRLGGESNRSWRNIVRQNLCIQAALRLNGLAPHPLYPVAKLLDKGRQFIVRPPAITDPVPAS